MKLNNCETCGKMEYMSEMNQYCKECWFVSDKAKEEQRNNLLTKLSKMFTMTIKSHN